MRIFQDSLGNNFGQVTEKMIGTMERVYPMIIEIGYRFDHIETEYPRFKYIVHFKRSRPFNHQELVRALHKYRNDPVATLILEALLAGEAMRRELPFGELEPIGFELFFGPMTLPAINVFSS